MGLLRRRGEPPVTAGEDPVVRQYRYLLRRAPADALLAVHEEALATLAPEDRGAVLRTVQEHLVVGLRSRPDDLPSLARLVTLGERRAPGAVLGHCDPAVLRRLAGAAVVAEAAFGLLGGYAAWDGLDPEPAPEPELDRELGSRWHDARLNPGASWETAYGSGGSFGTGDTGAF